MASCYFLPRLSIKQWNGDILSGNGPCLDYIRNDEEATSTLRVFDEDASNVYGMELPTENNVGFLVVYGEKNVAIVKEIEIIEGGILNAKRVVRFPDSILAVRILECHSELVILFACNTVVRLMWSIQNELLIVEELDRVQSDHTAVLLYSVLVGNTWNAMISIVGTIFGEILISKPSAGPQILRRCEGHTGMIFGLLYQKPYILSISDDRSLRVWDVGDIVNVEEDKKEERVPFNVNMVSCEYGHAARPFALCEGLSKGYFYTAGRDEVVCQWSFGADSILKLVKRWPINIGTIRSLAFVRGKLIAGSETGGLISLDVEKNVASDISPSQIIVDTDARSIYIDDVTLYSLSAKDIRCQSLDDNNRKILSWTEEHGGLYRYLVGPPLHNTLTINRRSVVAYGGCCFHVFPLASVDGKSMDLELQTTILSVVISPCNHIFVYCMNMTGYLYSFDESTVCLLAKFDATSALNGINKTKPLIPSCSLVIERLGREKEENSSYIMLIGSSSGHILFSEFTYSDGIFELKTSQEVNYHFGGEYVMDLCILNNHRDDSVIIRSLGKNGRMCTWKIDHDQNCPSISLLRNEVVSDGIGLDWPCAFIKSKDGEKEYVAGFHATTFYLIDLATRLPVMEVECGGGNRAWQLMLGNDCIARMYFLKKRGDVQDLWCYTEDLGWRAFCIPPPHRSQIIAACGENESDETDDRSSVISIGADNRLVWSRIRDKEWNIVDVASENTGFGCVDIIEWDNRRYVVTGGGKGMIGIWRLEKDSDGPTGVPILQLCHTKHSSESRIVSISFVKRSMECLRFVATIADGTIDCYRVDMIRTDSEPRFSIRRVGRIPASDLSLYTKVVGDKSLMFSVSSSGMFSVWLGNSTSEIVRTENVRIAHCGLSSLCVVSTVDDHNLPSTSGYYALIGAESGFINFIQLESDGTVVVDSYIARIVYHTATVTDLKCRIEPDKLSIWSIGLDCRLALHVLDTNTYEVVLKKCVPLGVWDPTSVVFISGDRVAVVGSGVEVIEEDRN